MGYNFVMGLSGGLDSAVLLGLIHSWINNDEIKNSKMYKDSEIHCFNFNYGSKHNKWERIQARKIAKYYNVNNYIEVDLESIFENFNVKSSTLLKNGGEIPHAHYEAPETKSTVVPGRNTIMTSIMMGYAESLNNNNQGVILFGAHMGDHANYPDCRLDYIKSLKKTFELATEDKVTLIAPFLDEKDYYKTDKIGIVKLGINLNVPFELTRTCYKDQEIACGECPSCIERLEAFEKNNIEDPIKYKNR